MSETLHGTIEAIVYTNPDNGFTVARLHEPGKREATTIVGTLTSIQPGEQVRAKGSWKMHPQFGRQFEISDYHVEMPSDVVGIQKYLESGMIKGIGKKYAERIIQKFGADTLRIMDETPHRLGEIEGIGTKKLAKIKKAWGEQKSIREVMLFLRTHGVSPGFAQKIFKAYGEKSIEKVKENPYGLAKEIVGVGFKTADLIASRLGFPLHSLQRLVAGIEFLLWELSSEGHTCYPRLELVPRGELLLGVEVGLIEGALTEMVSGKQLIEERGLVWLRPFYSYEQGIAREMFRICHAGQGVRSIQTEKAADWVEERLKIEFAEQQKVAVIAALQDKVHVITGGPGTGKSTITKAILAVSEKITDKILLAAPTGRAAKRLSEITRRHASTLHSLLEMDFANGGFKRGKDYPLNCDLLIVDEASMIDTGLMFSLLKAVPSACKVLFVGDIDQLPSVGAGTVLRDLILSGIVGVTRLTEIFRQAKGSRIIVNAHRINQGEFPYLGEDPKSDFHFIEAESPEAIRDVILRLVGTEIPERWGLDRVNDIQVLAPMKKGVVGIELLNEALQGMLNPSNQPLMRAGHRFHVGDKVMQIKNDYDKKVFNGDVGRILSIDREEEVVRVDFDGNGVEYDYTELEELVLAYAASVHKYQGSETPCVIMPIHTSHFKLLYRNLLYTGITRGKRLVYLVGTKKALGMAIHNAEPLSRYTGLLGALQGAKPSGTEQQLKFV